MVHIYNNKKIWFKAIAIGLVCLLVHNDIAFSLSPSPRSQPLAAVRGSENGLTISEASADLTALLRQTRRDEVFVCMASLLRHLLCNPEYRERATGKLLAELARSVSPGTNLSQFNFESLARSAQGDSFSILYTIKNGRVITLRYFLPDGKIHPRAEEIDLGGGKIIMCEALLHALTISVPVSTVKSVPEQKIKQPASYKNKFTIPEIFILSAATIALFYLNYISFTPVGFSNTEVRSPVLAVSSLVLDIGFSLYVFALSNRRRFVEALNTFNIELQKKKIPGEWSGASAKALGIAAKSLFPGQYLNIIKRKALGIFWTVVKERHKFLSPAYHAHRRVGKTTARLVAGKMRDYIKINGEVVLALPTGATPGPFYRYLLKQKGIDWAKVIVLNGDEFVGLAETDKQSFAYYMNENFINHAKKLGLREENIHLLNGNAADIESEVSARKKLLADLGGIDICVLGIGENAHLFYNEPGSDFDSLTRIVELTDRTKRQVASVFRNNPSGVPTHAITLGMKEIMDSKDVFLMAVGKSKEDAITKTLLSKPAPGVPASILQNHKDATFILDRNAARSLLDVPEKYPVKIIVESAIGMRLVLPKFSSLAVIIGFFAAVMFLGDSDVIKDYFGETVSFGMALFGRRLLLGGDDDEIYYEEHLVNLDPKGRKDITLELKRFESSDINPHDWEAYMIKEDGKNITPLNGRVNLTISIEHDKRIVQVVTFDLGKDAHPGVALTVFNWISQRAEEMGYKLANSGTTNPKVLTLFSKVSDYRPTKDVLLGGFYIGSETETPQAGYDTGNTHHDPHYYTTGGDWIVFENIEVDDVMRKKIVTNNPYWRIVFDNAYLEDIDILPDCHITVRGQVIGRLISLPSESKVKIVANPTPISTENLNILDRDTANVEKTDVRAVMAELLTRHKPNNVKITLKIEEDVPGTVILDAERGLFKQALGKIIKGISQVQGADIHIVVKMVNRQLAVEIIDLDYNFDFTDIKMALGKETASGQVTMIEKKEDFADVRFTMNKDAAQAQDFINTLTAQSFKTRNDAPIIIGLEESWMPDRYAQGLINAIKRLDGPRGFSGIKIVRASGEQLANLVSEKQKETGAKLLNIIILGHKDIVTSSAFDVFKNSATGESAFFAGIDPVNLERTAACGRYSYSWLVEMLNMAVKLSYDSDAYLSRSGIEIQRIGARTWLFIPEAKVLEPEELKRIYERQRKVITAA